MDQNHLSAIRIASEEAARAHAGQTRKDGITPYIVHPARVASLVGYFGGDHVAVISAWLHDVFEDCTPETCRHAQETIQQLPLPVEDIQKIHAIIRAVTKNQGLPKELRMPDSLGRILEAPQEAVLVKLCDRIDNLADADHRDEYFRTSYFRKSHVILEKLQDAALSYGYTDAFRTLENLIQNNPDY